MSWTKGVEHVGEVNEVGIELVANIYCRDQSSQCLSFFEPGSYVK